MARVKHTIADAGESLAQAARTALSHPLRSGLGALAMAVAVATVALVIAGLSGLAEFARRTTARSFGADTFLVAQVGSPGTLGRRELALRLERHPPIRRTDLRFLERHAGKTTYLAPTVQRSGEAVAGGRKFENAAIVGTGADLGFIRALEVRSGRFLSRDDEVRAAPVAVVGRDVAEALFPGLDPLGRDLRVGGRRLAVVGVQDRLGTSGGQSLDRYVWLPLSTHERIFGAATTLSLSARAREAYTTSEAEDRVRAALRARRRLRPGVPDNFDLLSPEAARGFVANLTERVSGAAAPLSLMALLAAIVVVTNTTLVSVTQRTREIGVRRALGATRRRIVQEVVLESALVAVAGSVAGLLAVAAAAGVVRAASGFPLELSAGTLAGSVGSAALAGVLAGLYPARRAARVDVIAAVRAE